MDYIHEQWLAINAEIAKVATAANRSPEEVKLVAVSKTFPPEAVLAAYQCGQRRFGENKVQELEAKATVLPADIEWHLLGHLQSNKVQRAVQFASVIHSVDSVKLLERIDRIAGEIGKHPKILIEVNLSGEASKFGIPADAAAEIVATAANARHLDCVGLMTMAPYEASEPDLKKIFSGLRDLRDQLASQYHLAMTELSMGMSGDFPAAIAAGATFLRIGTAIFGKRDYSSPIG